ncbi:MAG: CARDB domain-containing protein [bacterium]
MDHHRRGLHSDRHTARPKRPRSGLQSVALAATLGALAAVVGCGPSAETGNGDSGTTLDASVVDAGGGPDAGCPTGDPCGPLNLCCGAGEECVNDWQCLPDCDNVRCGENSETCCDVGDICLDGVDCAVNCPVTATHCGAELELCCDAGDVCLGDQCVTPGGMCDNNFDCLYEDWYCEQTIHRCLPLPGGPLCEGEPEFTAIEPVLEWFWPGVSYDGHYWLNSMTAPVVGDVNGDGTPDVVVVLFYAGSYTTGNLIAVLDGAGDGAGGGQLLFTIPSAADPTAPYAKSGSSVALGNFDADPGLEIVYNMQGGGVRIADNDGVGDVCDTAAYPGCQGTRTTGNGASTTLSGGLSLADLDHDGMPDVIIRCQALNGHNIGDPALDLMDRAGCGTSTVVADVDQDGRPEVIDGDHAYTADPLIPGGEELWVHTRAWPSGYIAVADLFASVPGPEVINIRNGFYVLNGLTGEVLVGPGGTLIDATIPIPGAGHGGAPTVADFDGDGLPEVSTAGLAAYVVYDPDCWTTTLRAGGQCASGATDLMLWTQPTQDLSSSSTGSSVFDFQGDGMAEVLYADECFFHIYEGLTGQELVNPILPSSSGTLSEYPLVADVDGDGNAEMVVVSSDYYVIGAGCHVHWKNAGLDIGELCAITTCTAGPPCTGGVGGTCSAAGEQCDASGICQLPGGTHGVRVYGDLNDRWVRTRPVWNQFGYHVTDFMLAGGFWDVPTVEVPNWIVYNNYRQNVQGGALFPVPDLALELTATAVCPNEIRLVATVTNQGSAGAPSNIPVLFYRTDADATNPPELIATEFTGAVLLPGAWERVAAIYPVPAQGVTMTFQVVVDDANEHEECDETNNSADSEPTLCVGVQ